MINTDVIEGTTPSPDSPEGIEFSKMNLKWGETLPKLMLAETDAQFDNILNEYKNYYEKAAKVFLPYMQKVYDENKKIFVK